MASSTYHPRSEGERDRFVGILLGGAIGDAIGFPFRGSSQAYMAALGADAVSSFEAHRSGLHPAGQYSCGTQMTLATAEALIECGDVDCDAIRARLLELWRDDVVIAPDPVSEVALGRVVRGIPLRAPSDPTREETREVVAGPGACLRIAPVVLRRFRDPQTALERVAAATRITDESAEALAAATALAAAYLHCLRCRELILGDFLDRMTAAAGRHDESLAAQVAELAQQFSRAPARTAAELAVAGTELDPEESDGVRETAAAVLLTALFYFLRSPTDVRQALAGCLSRGGATHQTCAVVVALCGAFGGARTLPAHLVAGVVGSEAIRSIAEKLYSESAN